MNEGTTNRVITPEERAARLAEAKEKSLRGMRATSTADIKTPEDLRERLLEYVNFMEDDLRFARLYGMNRRFGYVATQLGTSVREILELLVSEGALISHQQRSSRFFVTPDTYLALTEFNPASTVFENILKDMKANDY